MLTILAVAALAAGQSRLGLEKKEFNVPVEWQLLGRAAADQKLELIFAVKQNEEGVHALERVLLSVSDPLSSTYGEHLSNEAVHKLVAPSESAAAAVRDFLPYDAKSLTPNSDMISVVVPVSTAEKLLDTQYFSYRHSVTDTVTHRCASYSLPPAVARAVDFVSPTVRFPPSNPVPIFNNAENSVGTKVNPTILRTMYSVDDVVGASPKNKHAVTGFLNQHFHPADLKKFWTNEMVGVKAQLPNVKEVGDGVTGFKAGVEAMLDIEYINALGANIESEFWGFSGKSPDNPQNEPFLVWLAQLSNTSDVDVPLIFSTSYGEDEASTTQETADRTNIEFMKAGVRGISLLFASGDSGAAGVSPSGCPGKKFVAKWPAGSPYVTAVGGTNGMQAASLSSGGFCNRWATPSWQADATKAYLANTTVHVPPASYFNASGRGFPDISAQAEGFSVTCNGLNHPGVAGTSCASPTAAGVMALLNDLRLAAGKSPLGFLNPFIYQNAHAFNDITTGSGGGCGVTQAGFPAAVGWDPVTGVGTPNYKLLKVAVEALP